MSWGSNLSSCRLEFSRADRQLDEFKQWLNANSEFRELSVVTFLKSRPSLCQLIYTAIRGAQPDRYCYEFALQGAFRADFVVGSTLKGHFAFVEFEGGQRNSIFNQKRGTARLRDWGSQIQHAFSQVSDWAWAKNDSQHTALYNNAFGMTDMSETYVIICGRDAFLDPTETRRLRWRSDHTTIGTSAIHFWTYDQFHANATATLDIWRDVRDDTLASAQSS